MYFGAFNRGLGKAKGNYSEGSFDGLLDEDALQHELDKDAIFRIHRDNKDLPTIQETMEDNDTRFTKTTKIEDNFLRDSDGCSGQSMTQSLRTKFGKSINGIERTSSKDGTEDGRIGKKRIAESMPFQ